jgi:hypothetical protein
MDTGGLKTTAERVRKHLTRGLRIMFRMRNDRLDYSIMDRPEPTFSGITDEVLATTLVDAVQRFTVERAGKPTRVTEYRSDGKAVTYKEIVTFDWNEGVIRSSVSRDVMLKVLSIVVQNLIKDASRARAQKGGLN